MTITARVNLFHNMIAYRKAFHAAPCQKLSVAKSIGREHQHAHHYSNTCKHVKVIYCSNKLGLITAVGLYVYYINSWPFVSATLCTYIAKHASLHDTCKLAI